MKIGVFYQSGHKLVACYMAIQQFRKFYPDAPIALYEDGSTILENVANEFNCVYKHIGTVGINNQTSGRVFKGEDGPKAWLDRIYDACTTTLKDVDWVIHYEDDVWCLREIKIPPRFDISGALWPQSDLSRSVRPHECRTGVFVSKLLPRGSLRSQP
jgi:hypothetical protein